MYEQLLAEFQQYKKETENKYWEISNVLTYDDIDEDEKIGLAIDLINSNK